MVSISIIIPVYNTEHYVRRCFQSIINQGDLDADVECIIVDDGSTDNSYQVIRSIIESYSGNINFIYEKHDVNRGLSAARNTGISMAKGDYVFFMDSDDWLPTGALSEFISLQREHPQADMIIGNHFDTQGGCAYSTHFSEPTFLGNYRLRKSLLNNQDVICSAWNKLIRSQLLTNHLFTEGIIFEDIYWAYFLFRDIQYVVLFPKITYVYESTNPGSITKTANTPQKVSLQVKSVTQIFNAILDNPYKDMYSDSVLGYFSFFINALNSNVKNEVDDDSWRELLKTRRRIVAQTFKDGRWFLSFAIYLLTYKPFSHIFDIGFVRHHYQLVYIMIRSTCYFLETINYPFRKLKGR